MLNRVAARTCAALVWSASLAGSEPAQADRLQQYLGLAQATMSQPITAAELEAAVLSPPGVDDVAALFEEAVQARLVVDGTPVTPERGGEATLDGGRLRFVGYADPIHAVVRRLIVLEDDPAALLSFLSSSADGQHVLHSTGGLHALLYQMTTRPATPEQRAVLRRVVKGAVETHFKTWSLTPEVQREEITRHEWRGRYVGFWHIHPPRSGPGGYAPGMEPSLEDLALAAEKGQFLTLVFQPDGFDLYDLAGVAGSGRVSLSDARVVRHRSEAWARRFRALLP